MMTWLIIFAALGNFLMIAWVAAGWHARRKKRSSRKSLDGISVVVAARNEGLRLRACLTSLANQATDVTYEVVVVLDRCTDHSAEIAQEMRALFPKDNLRVVEVEALPVGWTGKKHALTKGIEASKHDHLVFTDADCVAEPGWLQGMAEALQEGADLVLGSGPMRKRKGLLNLLQRFETFMTAFLYMGMAGQGRAYMGVGRSIAYTKRLFTEVSGFESHKGRLSGDDDLLVNAVAGSAQIGLLNREGARTFSDAPQTWSAWLTQKMRHHSAAPAYKLPSKLILGAFHGLHAIFYLSLALALICGEDPVRVLAVWGGRTILAGIFWATFPWPNRRDLLIFSPVLDLMYVLYLLIAGPAGMLRKPRWKGN